MQWALFLTSLMIAALLPLAWKCLSWAFPRSQKKEIPATSIPAQISRCGCRCGCQEWRSLLKACKLCHRPLCSGCRRPVCRPPDLLGDETIATPALILGEWCHVCFDEELAVEAVMRQDRELQDQMAEEAAEVQDWPEEWPTPSPRHRAYSSSSNGFGSNEAERAVLMAAGFSP